MHVTLSHGRRCFCEVACVCVYSSPEQCDDGNQINGDGCDSNCQNEPPPPGLRTATRQTTALILRCDFTKLTFITIPYL